MQIPYKTVSIFNLYSFHFTDLTFVSSFVFTIYLSTYDVSLNFPCDLVKLQCFFLSAQNEQQQERAFEFAPLICKLAISIVLQAISSNQIFMQKNCVTVSLRFVSFCSVECKQLLCALEVSVRIFCHKKSLIYMLTCILYSIWCCCCSCINKNFTTHSPHNRTACTV